MKKIVMKKIVRWVLIVMLLSAFGGACIGYIQGCNARYYAEKLEDMNAGLPDMRTQWE